MKRFASNPRNLAISLLRRSVCAVQVGAVILDNDGVISIGWNSSGPSGMGEHAEAAAIRRANRKRLPGASVFIAGRRKKSIFSRPCPDCEHLLRVNRVRRVYYTTGNGLWRVEVL